MPFKTKPQCIKCEKTESPMWTNEENGVICLECTQDQKVIIPKTEPTDDNKSETTSTNGSKDPENGSKPIRRSTRSTRYCKNKQSTYSKTLQPKGKGRRVIFKKTPMKAPTAVATPITSNSIFYKGTYIQVGDIVSMIDDNNDIYYAQIRGLLTDQYCEKSAVVTWLLPTEESPHPEEGFDPATYIIGPEEEVPRKLECMEFVMHAPSEYYKAKTTPYPSVHATPEPGFIWTSLHPIQS